MVDFDWNLVRSFLAVAETGSLSAAARQLLSSQPTIGRHVAELERDLGVVLFRRGLGGYDLTEDGVMLAAQAASVREAMDRFALHATGSSEHMSGTVRITASEIVATLVLPAMLARFAVLEPDIEIELIGSNQIDNLLRRDADIAIRMVNPSQEELVARKIADIGLTMCAHESYLARKPEPRTPYDLLTHDLIGQDRGEELVRGFRAYDVKVDRHTFRFRTDNQVIMWEAVRVGLGIGIAQIPLVAREPYMRALMPDLPLPVMPMWLTMHKDVRTSPRIRRTADFVYEALSAFARSAAAV